VTNIVTLLYLLNYSNKKERFVQALYHRLTLKRKIFKVAITACVRKMLTIMNAMAQDKAHQPALTGEKT
jgi:hypothetical protein